MRQVSRGARKARAALTTGIVFYVLKQESCDETIKTTFPFNSGNFIKIWHIFITTNSSFQEDKM